MLESSLEGEWGKPENNRRARYYKLTARRDAVSSRRK